MAGNAKIRRILKRAGILICAAILVLAIVSIWRGFLYRANSIGIGLSSGRVFCLTLDGTPSDVQKLNLWIGRAMGWSYHVGTWRTAQLFSWPETNRYEYSRTHLITRLFGDPDNRLQGTVTTTWYSLPLWMPLVATGIPTLFLIWRDRRRYMPGRCVLCDYDLTGNVSGRCSECGTSCSLRSLWPIRLRRLVRCLRPGLAALIMLLGGGLWFYTFVASPPRIIASIGHDGGAHFFTALRRIKPTFLSRLSPLARNCNWDGEWLFVSGNCESCWKPGATRYSFVLAKLPDGLAYATMDSSASGHSHLTRPKYVSANILFPLMAVSSILVMLSPYLLSHAKRLFVA